MQYSGILFMLILGLSRMPSVYATEEIGVSVEDTLKPTIIDLFSLYNLLYDQPLKYVDHQWNSPSNNVHKADSTKLKEQEDGVNNLQAAIWFEHSPPTFQKLIKDKPFVFCEVSYQRTSTKDAQLLFSLHVYKKNSLEKFGDISTSSPLLIYRLNGDPVILPIHKTRMNEKAKSDYVTFEIVCLVKKADIQSLIQAEMDKVQFSFTKGDLSFEIFNIAFFKHYLKPIQAWK